MGLNVYTREIVNSGLCLYSLHQSQLCMHHLRLYFVY